MADMIIAFLQDELAQLLARPFTTEELAETNEPLQPPMLPQNYEHSSTCLEEAKLQQAVLRAKAAPSSLLLLLLRKSHAANS